MKGLLKKLNPNLKALTQQKNLTNPRTKKIWKFQIGLMMAAKIPNQPKTTKFFYDILMSKHFLAWDKNVNQKLTQILIFGKDLK